MIFFKDHNHWKWYQLCPQWQDFALGVKVVAEEKCSHAETINLFDCKYIDPISFFLKTFLITGVVVSIMSSVTRFYVGSKSCGWGKMFARRNNQLVWLTAMPSAGRRFIGHKQIPDGWRGWYKYIYKYNTNKDEKNKYKYKPSWYKKQNTNTDIYIYIYIYSWQMLQVLFVALSVTNSRK